MTSNERPTPETDAIEQGMFGSDSKLIADFARRLERERDEAREAAEKAKSYKRVLKEDNAKLRRELDELNKRLIEVCQYGVVCTIEREDLHKERDKARDDTRVLLKEIFNITQVGDPHPADLPMKALQAIAEMIDEHLKEARK